MDLTPIMADDRSIEDILCSIQHHDQGIRRSGEILYHQFQSSINYVDIVIKFSSDAAKPAHCRHLAIVLLNQQIAKDWNSFPQNSKSALVQFSFDRCSDQIAAIRTACMLMLSKIASQSSEIETKDILTYLSGQLMSPDRFITTATLKCLCTIAEEGE